MRARLRESATDTLVFGYAMTETDGDRNVMLLTAESLALNGGSIRRGREQYVGRCQEGACSLPDGHRPGPRCCASEKIF